MNAYSLSLIALAGAIVAQAVITALCLESGLQKWRERRGRQAWLAMAIGSTVLAMHHFKTLELAAQTGIYDVQQALLAVTAAFFVAFGVYALSRQAS